MAEPEEMWRSEVVFEFEVEGTGGRSMAGKPVLGFRMSTSTVRGVTEADITR